MTPFLDRFHPPQELTVAHTCEECGYEILKGETYYEVDGSILCSEVDCFTELAKKLLNYAQRRA